MAIAYEDKLKFVRKLEELPAELLDEEGDECWPWPGGTSGENNYGRFETSDGKGWYAHRFAWALEHGDIPPGVVIRHRCDNSICCRLKHLLSGTQRENQEDKARRRRAVASVDPTLGIEVPIKDVAGAKNGNASLTENDVLEMRKLWEETNTTRTELSQKYGVSQHQVSRIIRRKCWRHI